ncbi:hypothetical protein C8F01DRAFT_448934 [Mycena amicta]|nr:hypothetical protein C8F01DRAFT_448934 [Mycena amicta]
MPSSKVLVVSTPAASASCVRPLGAMAGIHALGGVLWYVEMFESMAKLIISRPPRCLLLFVEPPLHTRLRPFPICRPSAASHHPRPRPPPVPDAARRPGPSIPRLAVGAVVGGCTGNAGGFTTSFASYQSRRRRAALCLALSVDGWMDGRRSVRRRRRPRPSVGAARTTDNLCCTYHIPHLYPPSL